MGKQRFWAALGAALALLAGVPAGADPGALGAEKLRRLDIMLMVTGLRCRTSADDFRAEYGAFTSRHLATLNKASDAMKSELARRFGEAGANRALDRISTTMANSYGQGHPWLSCAELRMVARNLAQVRGEATLIEAADQLLAPSGSMAQLAYARR